MNRKLLITGCNGFVGGKAVARFLAAGDEVFGLDRFGEAAPGVRFLRDGVSSESLSAFGVEFDAILHFAGTGTVGAAAADPEAARRDTVDASAAVLEHLRLHPATRLVYASSAAVYGNAGGVLREDLPLDPISAYGRHKAEVEGLCREYHDKYGCRVSVIRPFSIYGTGLRKQLLWDFCGRVKEAMARGATSVRCFGTGREQRDFVSIDDVLALVDTLVDSAEPWQVVNAGTGVATPVGSVLTAICREMGFGGTLDYDGVVRPGDPETLVADVSRQRMLGFACQTDVAAGIAAYVKWFRAQEGLTGMKVLKVGFLNYFSQFWMGGVTYFKNLFQAMQTVRDPILKPYIVKPAEPCGDVLLDVAEIMADAELPWSGPTPMPRAKDYGMDVISHLQECKAVDGIAWIADFQHKHLPEMFGAEEIAKRDHDFDYLAKTNRLVILSSDDALRDFRTFYPEQAHKGRRLHFVAIPEPEALADRDVAETCGRLKIPERFFYVPNQFWKHKNHLVVLKAVARLKKRGVDVTVVCSGKTVDMRFPGYFDELMTFCKTEGIEENVRVVGLIDRQDVYFLQRQCVSLINPSKFEGWSSSVEEAKSVGKTIILSDLPVHIEQDPPQGRFFPRDDDARLAEIMEQVWNELPPGPDAGLEKLARERLPERIRDFGEAFKKILLEAYGSPAVSDIVECAVAPASAPQPEIVPAEQPVSAPLPETDRAVVRMGPVALRLTTLRFRIELCGRACLQVSKASVPYRLVKRGLRAFRVSGSGLVCRIGAKDRSKGETR